jgi:hypothetical protein
VDFVNRNLIDVVHDAAGLLRAQLFRKTGETLMSQNITVSKAKRYADSWVDAWCNLMRRGRKVNPI